MYTYLAYGRATDPIPAADLKELVLTIAAMPAGFYVAVEILHMRLHSEEERKAGIAPELLDAGCALMQQYRFTEKNDREDYRLGAITKSCLIGAKGAACYERGVSASSKLLWRNTKPVRSIMTIS